MRFRVFSRSELAAICSQARSLEHASAFSDAPLLPSKETVVGVWPSIDQARTSLPTTLITKSSEVQECIAFLSVYFGEVRPFTGICRILGDDLWKSLQPRDRQWNDVVSRSLAALMVCELAAVAKDDVDVKQLPIISFKTTLAYSLSRLFFIWGDNARLGEELVARWETVERLGSVNRHHIPGSLIKDVWEILTAALAGARSVRTKSSSRIADCIASLRSSGGISVGQLCELLPAGFPRDVLQEYLIMAKGRREDRVRMFNQIRGVFLSWKNAGRDPGIGFVLGFLGSLLGDNALEYLGLIRTLAIDCPAAVLWYGVCDAISPKSRVDFSMNGLIEFLRRDMTIRADLVDPPECDIGLDELRVLSESASVSDYRFKAQSYVAVEVVPLVVAYLHVRRSDSISVEAIKDKERTAKMQEAIRQAMFHLHDVLEQSFAIDRPSKSRKGGVLFDDDGLGPARGRPKR